MKKLLTLLCVLTGTVLSYGQDTIYKKDNTTVLGQVTEISVNEIKFKRTDLPNGPVYSEKRSDVKEIHYSNGTKDVFQLSPENAKAASTVTKDVKPRYVLTLTDATKLKGTVIREGNREIVFLDDNFGERTINRKDVASLEREYGNESWIIKLRDGTIISGKVLSKDETETIVQTQNLGTVKLNSSKISSITPLDGTVDKKGKFWFRNPVATMYFITPNAIPMKKGEGYYHNYYGLGNQFQYGITDHISMGGGLLGPFGVYLMPKVSTSVNSFAHVSGGLFVGNSIVPIVYNSNFGIALGFASFTVGNDDRNLTASVSYGVTNSRNQTEWITQPLFQVSGQYRLTKKLVFVTENWMVSVKGDPFGRGFRSDYHYEPFISYGARILSQKGSFDIGFINTPAFWENQYFLGIPYIGFVVKFGKTEED